MRTALPKFDYVKFRGPQNRQEEAREWYPREELHGIGLLMEQAPTAAERLDSALQQYLDASTPAARDLGEEVLIMILVSGIRLVTTLASYGICVYDPKVTNIGVRENKELFLLDWGSVLLAGLEPSQGAWEYQVEIFLNSVQYIIGTTIPKKDRPSETYDTWSWFVTAARKWMRSLKEVPFPGLSLVHI